MPSLPRPSDHKLSGQIQFPAEVARRAAGKSWAFRE